MCYCLYNLSETLPELKLFPDNKVGPDPRGNISTHNHSGKTQKKPKSDKDTMQTGTSPQDSGSPPLGAETKGGKSKRLIQELRSDVSASYEATEEGGRVCVPEHSVAVVEDVVGGGGRRGVKVKVNLPGVRGVKEVELEVSEVIYHSYNTCTVSYNGNWHNGKTGSLKMRWS